MYKTSNSCYRKIDTWLPHWILELPSWAPTMDINYLALILRAIEKSLTPKRLYNTLGKFLKGTIGKYLKNDIGSLIIHQAP